MKDPVLDQRLENCKTLLGLWRKFHDFLRGCVQDMEFDAKAEAAFLRLKSQIAISHDSFMESIEQGNRESTATAQDIISVVERCIMLRTMKRMSPAEMKKMELEWHESYLLVNETIGLLQEEVDSLAEVSHFHHSMQAVIATVLAKLSRLIHSKGLHASLGILAVVTVLVVLPMMDVYSYDFLNNYSATKPAYQLGRDMLRNSVAKNLAYQDWEVFARKGLNPIPRIYGRKQELDRAEKDATEASMLYSEAEGIEPLDLRDNMTGALEKDVEIFENYRDGTTFLFMALLPKTEDARKFVDEFDNWHRKVMLNPVLRDDASRVTVSRKVNAVFMVLSATEDRAKNLTDHMALKEVEEE